MLATDRTSGRELDDADLALAQELARRAASAIEHARLFSDVQEVAEELLQANATKDEFLGLISHELRTPVTTILGNAQVLLRVGATLNDEDRLASLAAIEQEAQRLRGLIDNLFALARVEDQRALTIEPVALRHLIQRPLGEHRRR